MPSCVCVCVHGQGVLNALVCVHVCTVRECSSTPYIALTPFKTQVEATTRNKKNYITARTHIGTRALKVLAEHLESFNMTSKPAFNITH